MHIFFSRKYSHKIISYKPLVSVTSRFTSGCDGVISKTGKPLIKSFLLVKTLKALNETVRIDATPMVLVRVDPVLILK
jgi:hypothetical protein